METINNQKVSGIVICESENNTITVDISVDPIGHKEKEVRITTKDLMLHLKEVKNLDVQSCIKSSVVTNTHETSRFGTWIFAMDKIQVASMDHIIEPHEELQQESQDLGLYDAEESNNEVQEETPRKRKKKHNQKEDTETSD